jgi:preprotein translocase subunit SecE
VVSTNTSESSQSILDWLKWLVVVALLGGGIFGNWYYQDQSLLNRVLVLVAIAGVAIAIALQTERGRVIWALMKESRVEIRRVIWPTRQETTQTTFIVVLLVLVFSLILWALDSLLSWFVAKVIG